MRMPKVLGLVCVAVALLAPSIPAAWSQAKTLKIIVPYTPGSGPDILSRLMGEQFPRAGGPTVLVENRPGAQGLVALSSFVKERTDGYNLFMLASSQAVLPALYHLPYDPVNDITPIARLTVASVILVVNPDLPVMRAIGVAELGAHLRGDMTLEEAVAFGTQATRRYAKRQYTWFAHQPPPEWPRFHDPLVGEAIDRALAMFVTAG